MFVVFERKEIHNWMEFQYEKNPLFPSDGSADELHDKYNQLSAICE